MSSRTPHDEADSKNYDLLKYSKSACTSTQHHLSLLARVESSAQPQRLRSAALASPCRACCSNPVNPLSTRLSSRTLYHPTQSVAIDKLLSAAIRSPCTKIFRQQPRRPNDNPVISTPHSGRQEKQCISRELNPARLSKENKKEQPSTKQTNDLFSKRKKKT